MRGKKTKAIKKEFIKMWGKAPTRSELRRLKIMLRGKRTT